MHDRLTNKTYKVRKAVNFMKKNIAVITSLILVLCIGCAFAVSAIDDFATPKTPIVKDKLYYAYYNETSQKGAIAFCLNNQFTAFGKSEQDISVCTLNADGNYVILHKIPRENISVWFSGTTEVKVNTGESVNSLLGGLSAIGITADSTKTNVALSLTNQSIAESGSYYIYIPENYFTDAAGVSNEGGYVAVEPERVNSYSGNLLEDLKDAAENIYDAAIWGVEALTGILSGGSQ